MRNIDKLKQLTTDLNEMNLAQHLISSSYILKTNGNNNNKKTADVCQELMDSIACDLGRSYGESSLMDMINDKQLEIFDVLMDSCDEFAYLVCEYSDDDNFVSVWNASLFDDLEVDLVMHTEEGIKDLGYLFFEIDSENDKLYVGEYGHKHVERFIEKAEELL